MKISKTLAGLMLASAVMGGALLIPSEAHAGKKSGTRDDLIIGKEPPGSMERHKPGQGWIPPIGSVNSSKSKPKRR